jgi:choline dehydrogenase-like flavoprotein
MNLVVGSGPSGVAASLALLERGQPVTMLDFGREIEPEYARVPAGATGLPYETWSPEVKRRLASISGPMEDGLPMKTNFGSDFAVRREPELMPLELHDATILLSLARGGLSNLWGSNVFTFCADDFTGWPIGEPELREAYRAVLAHVPLSARRGDALEAMFPLVTDRLQERPLSEQALQMLSDMDRSREALAARGVTYGASRLGLRTAASEHDPGCVRCGFCLHGCPNDLIYHSSQTLETLRRDPRFRYEGGIYVTRFAETAGAVEVEGVRAAGRQPVRFSGERVFVAAGAYSTARMVMESVPSPPSEVLLLESQYFLIPILQWRSFPRVTEERLTTLSQLCLRLRDPGFGPRDVHLLLYTFNPLYPIVLRRSLARLVPGLPRALLSRLSSLQGYLHSDVSPRLVLSLRRSASGPATLRIEGRTAPESLRVVKRVEARVRSLAPYLRATPVPFMTKIGQPGKSYHGGGTFPMKREPRGFESDLLGRVAGSKRVHLVDSSVFPAIPATNMTLTLMANAYRIAAESAALEAGR